MSRRFGWLVIAGNLKAQEHQLLAAFRQDKIPIQSRKEKAADHLMWKVDDDLEICLGFGEGFTVVQGQFDFGLSSFEVIDELCREYSQNSMALWLSVEGTSESYLFKKFKKGTLVQSYASCEGHIETEMCLGRKPEENEHNQIGEWELVKEIEKEGILFEAIVSLELEVFNFAQPGNPPDAAKNKWW